MKRTTFMVDEALLDEAKTVLGTKNYSETLDIALREAIRVKNVMGLTEYFGKGLWHGDLKEMREDRFPKPLARKAKAGK